jgi:hypothetical protein
MTKNLTQGLTLSEKFVNNLCELSFLKLWINPKGKKDAVNRVQLLKDANE